MGYFGLKNGKWPRFRKELPVQLDAGPSPDLATFMVASVPTVPGKSRAATPPPPFDRFVDERAKNVAQILI